MGETHIHKMGPTSGSRLIRSVVRSVSSLLLAGIITFICSQGTASEAATKCPVLLKEGQTQSEAASELFDEGTAAFKKKHYKKSFRKFMCSLLLADHINTVFNIAQVVPFLKNKRKSLKVLHKYVAEHDDNWTTKEMKKIIITIEKQLKRRPSWEPSTVLHDSEDSGA